MIFLKPMEPAVQRLVERVQAAQPVRAAAPAEAGRPARLAQAEGPER
jgi:hypothetical protein